MRIVKYRGAEEGSHLGIIEGERIVPLADTDAGAPRLLSDLLETDDPAAEIEARADRRREALRLADVQLLAPIDQQEVWAAGVTYYRSRTARMEESQRAAYFYDLVYDADRPELFFKANPHRVVGPDAAVRIRSDATWNVPEPELALVLDSRLRLVGFTIGNDMSSRDIEGANPLYLPQAKVYDQCCALGPCITLASAMPEPAEIGIRLTVQRDGREAFAGQTDVTQMRRTFADLVSWLGRDSSFPHGAILLTGTGIVPGDEFSLQPGDRIEIAIDGIGTLSNPVVQG